MNWMDPCSDLGSAGATVISFRPMSGFIVFIGYYFFTLVMLQRQLELIYVTCVLELNSYIGCF